MNIDERRKEEEGEGEEGALIRRRGRRMKRWKDMSGYRYERGHKSRRHITPRLIAPFSFYALGRIE